MAKKTRLGDMQEELKKKMKREGATDVPQESTYIRTAHEQAMAGKEKEAFETMDYSSKGIASKQIAKQDTAEGKAVGEQMVKNVEAVKARLKKRQGK